MSLHVLLPGRGGRLGQLAGSMCSCQLHACRCDAVTALLSMLSGISVLNSSPELLQLQLTTACPAGALGGAGFCG